MINIDAGEHVYGVYLSKSKIEASVESVTRSPPVTVLFSDSVSSIVDKMLTYDVGAVIVMSGGRPVGIITERDILERVVKAHKDPDKTYANAIMSSPIIFIDSGKSLGDALTTMRDKHIRRLAVLKGGNLVGIVTERRVLSFLA